MSFIAFINASVVHGQGLGSSSHDVLASDRNVIVKYADDTYLSVSSSYRRIVASELAHIATWVCKNNLKLSADKSRDMLMYIGVRAYNLQPQ